GSAASTRPCCSALKRGASVGLRVNGVYENGESFRRHVDLERYGVNPTVGILAGPNTRIDVSYEYFHDHRTTDRGVPARNGRPIEGFDEVFFGDPELSYAKADVHVGTLAIHHDFGNGLSLRNRTLLGNYDKFYQNVFPSGIVAPRVGETGDQVALGAYNSRNDRKNLFNQTDLIWEGRLGGIDQTLLLGFEAGRQRSRNLRLTGAFAGGDNRFPLTDPTIDADLTWAPSATDGNNCTQATVASVYVQDQIRLSPMLEIVAGLRFDRFKLSFNDLRPGRADFVRQDETWSPRLGLIFKPQPSLSVYTSFSRSFLPQSGDQFGSLDVNTDALKPERFDNFEIGAKWEPLAGLLATVAIYRLDRTNTRASDPADPTRFVLTGEQRSKGLEVGLERSVSDRWQIAAGYALQKAEIRSRTTACNPALAECRVPLVPRHQFSLWNRYDVTRKLGLGLGVIARTKSFASIGNAVTLPGYTRVDGAAFYKITPRVQAQVNVENVLGASYFPTAHSDNNIAPGAPRTLRATLRFGL
ncbi:MAG TPA: TonB-dependent receptor, partial [Sphingomicrobium sp.]